MSSLRHKHSSLLSCHCYVYSLVLIPCKRDKTICFPILEVNKSGLWEVETPPRSQGWWQNWVSSSGFSFSCSESFTAMADSSVNVNYRPDLEQRLPERGQMDKQTAICLLPASPAPTPLVRNESHCQKTKMVSEKDLSASRNAGISLSNDVTRTEGSRPKKGVFL